MPRHGVSLHVRHADCQREGDLLVLDALSSLAYQSHANPDGFGLAAFCTDGELSLVCCLVRAVGDEDFGRHARETHAATFLVHVRYADIGEISEANTHPFVLDGRAFAHNGVAGKLEELDRRLGEDRRNVAGETDSERVFVLISRAIQRNTQCAEQLCSDRMWDV